MITDGTSNYTTDNKCTWLIESSGSTNGDAVTPVLPVRLKFDEFITECSWDHLYIFDGSSVYDPLIAVFRYCLQTLLLFLAAEMVGFMHIAQALELALFQLGI